MIGHHTVFLQTLIVEILRAKMSSRLKSGEESLQFAHRNRRGRRELISYSALHRSIVTVYVSPEQYPFYFHKGRLCQASSFFEKRFYGSVQDAPTGSMYLEMYGVDEFKLFEEWLYAGKLNYPKDSDDPSLVLVKVFCLAKDVEMSNLQNATLDVIRDRATEQYVSPTITDTNHHEFANPQYRWSAPPPHYGLQAYETSMPSPGLEEPVAKYLPPATTSAIHYAYQKTSEPSPLRRLLTDIFAYDVKPEALYEDTLSYPTQFIADVLVTTQKRLPFRLKGEEADFDKNADKYHVPDSSSTCNDRRQRTSEDREVRGTKSDSDLREGPAAEAIPDPEPEPEPTEAVDQEPEPTAYAVPNTEDDAWGLGGPVRSSMKKAKMKKRSYKVAKETVPDFES